MIPERRPNRQGPLGAECSLRTLDSQAMRTFHLPVLAARLREVAAHANDEAVIAAPERYPAATNGIKTG